LARIVGFHGFLSISYTPTVFKELLEENV